MAAKRHDLHGAYCCSSCHDVIDGRRRFPALSSDEIRIYHLEGVIRTQQILIDEGVIRF